MPWSRFEFAKRKLAEDWDDIGPVKGNSTDVEDSSDGDVGSETDEVNGDAEEYRNPDGVDGGSRQAIDLGPNVGKW